MFSAYPSSLNNNKNTISSKQVLNIYREFTENYRYLCYDSAVQMMRNSVMELERYRRSAHEHAISSCKVLNRYCSTRNLDFLWYEGDLDNRYEVADFCGAVISALYNNGIKPTEAVKISQRKSCYPCVSKIYLYKGG